MNPHDFTTNVNFYRSTRESAFNLTLSYPQIEMLLLVDKVCEDCHNNGYDTSGQFPRTLDGDMTPAAYWDGFYHRSTVQCLYDKGLVFKFCAQPVISTAGRAVLEVLRISGHVMKKPWLKEKAA